MCIILFAFGALPRSCEVYYCHFCNLLVTQPYCTQKGHTSTWSLAILIAIGLNLVCIGIKEDYQFIMQVENIQLFYALMGLQSNQFA